MKQLVRSAIVIAVVALVLVAFARPSSAQEMVCFELPTPDCGCGLERIVEEEPVTVCVPVKRQRDKTQGFEIFEEEQTES